MYTLRLIDMLTGRNEGCMPQLGTKARTLSGATVPICSLARRRTLPVELTMQQAGAKVGNWNSVKVACCFSGVVANKHRHTKTTSFDQTPADSYNSLGRSARRR